MPIDTLAHFPPRDKAKQAASAATPSLSGVELAALSLGTRAASPGFCPSSFLAALTGECAYGYASRSLRKRCLELGYVLPTGLDCDLRRASRWRQCDSEQSAHFAVQLLTGVARDSRPGWTIRDVEFVRASDRVAAPEQGTFKLLQFGCLHWAVIVEGYWIQSCFDPTTARGVRPYARAYAANAPVVCATGMPNLHTQEVEVFIMDANPSLLKRYCKRLFPKVPPKLVLSPAPAFAKVDVDALRPEAGCADVQLDALVPARTTA